MVVDYMGVKWMVFFLKPGEITLGKIWANDSSAWLVYI